MELVEYLAHLVNFIEENPDALKLEVITSIDNEGNGHNRVHYAPGTMIKVDGEYEPCEPGDTPDAVCLN